MQDTGVFCGQTVKLRGSSILGRGRVPGFGENQKSGGSFERPNFQDPAPCREKLGVARQVLLGCVDAEGS